MAIKKESLIASTNRIEAPFIRIEINGYTFGVYEEKQHGIGPNGMWKNISTKFPNYVQSLSVKKINGQVNQYEFSMSYPVTQYDDPNFFEKLFSSVSGTRKIKFSYGDFMVPDHTFRDESAIITNITVNPGISNSVISYTITAVSDTVLTNASNYSFPATTDKPSNVIKYYLFNEQYHLQDLFLGMKDPSLVEGLIANDDQIVYIEPKPNVSIMEYLSYLVSNMIPTGNKADSVIQGSLYALSVHEDTTGTYGGSYFTVQKIENQAFSLESICTYELDIGYPSANIVTDFSITKNNNWSIYYNYNRQASSTDYVKRVNSKGELELVYTPELTRGNYTLENDDKTWWTRVTEFPIEASITIRGLLKPSILMNYVKINMWYWGHKYLLSGYYLISGQEDRIDNNGYRTTLSLIRVAGDNDQAYETGNISYENEFTGDSTLTTGVSNAVKKAKSAKDVFYTGGTSRGAGAGRRT